MKRPPDFWYWPIQWGDKNRVSTVQRVSGRCVVVYSPLSPSDVYYFATGGGHVQSCGTLLELRAALLNYFYPER